MESSPDTSKTYARLPPYIASILNSYSEIFFIQGKLSGVLLLSISLINYNTALAGLFSVAIAYAFAYFIGFKKTYLNSGYYTYNPLLVGLAIGYIFQLNWLTLGIVAIASVLAFVLTVFLANIFFIYLRLQILSIPFVIVSSLVYLAGARFTNLYVTGLYTQPIYQDITWFPEAINAFFKAMGSIIFMPNVLSGILISVLIISKSRILLMLAVAGFALGSTINALFSGSWSQSLDDVSNFNYILIAIAIGGVFNVPSPKSFGIAAIAVAVSTLVVNAVNVFWSQYGIPVFTLPFTLITLSFIYLLGLVDYQLRPVVFKSTPEETLDHFLTSKHRFPETPITLRLPFNGSWSVWQGFDGRWTHQGVWRHAYDFVITDADGSTYKNAGDRLDDYFAFRQPVISPVRGRVIKVVSHFIDNPVGSVDTINNWGNMIIIHDERGYFVELSHFAKDSIEVFEGQWVEPGAYLGLCGNSGYSPQPHIHVQVQTTALTGSETVPFTFVHYTEGSQYHAHGLPAENMRVATALPTPLHDQLTTFILDERLDYIVYRDGREIEKIQFVVKMALDGTFYFSRGDAKLYFGKYAGAFFMYHLDGNDPYLKLLYLAVASMPLHNRIQLSWDDAISNCATLGYAKGAFAAFLNAFIPARVSTKAQYQFTSETTITGKVCNDFFGIRHRTHVDLDPYLKFKRVKVDDIELRRKPDQLQA